MKNANPARGAWRRWAVSVVCGGLLSAFAFGLSLDGAWRLDYFPQPDDAPIRTLPLTVAYETVAAEVPGNCELDLVRAGVLPPAEVGLNARALRPYEGYQWLYTKTFTAPSLQPGERFSLRFEMIDTLADVFVNGVKVGEAENMFIPHRFDVTKAVRPGAENVVQVLIRSVMLAARDEVIGQLGHFTGGGGDAEPFRKAFHMGGWDILPRVFAAGLCRSVALDVLRPERIDCVNWIVKDYDPKKREAAMNAYARIRAPWSRIERATVRYTLSRNGTVAFEETRPFHFAQNYITFKLSRPDLWWPRGFGESALYDARIELLDAEGVVLAADARKIGIRTIELVREDWRSKESPGQFLVKVNGEPCFMRGTNWVPVDAFHGRDDRLMGPVLDMLADLNCNMVRVWGGGVYESDRFYDWCDANGVLVWQDFMMGCAVFPQNPTFLANFRREVLETVLRLRNHPSLAIWSGNNEVDMFYQARVGKRLAPDPNRDKPSREIIPDVLMEFDVTRPYLPSSPYYSPAVAAGLAQPSEKHLWGGCSYYKAPFYTNSVARFVSETGYHGCPRVDSLREMFTAESVYPWRDVADRSSWKDEWRFKATAPLMDKKFQPVLWNRLNMIRYPVERVFGTLPEDLEDYVEASEIVQAEALKYFVEFHRVNKFGRSNGLLWWNLRDGWPVISDAVVDYYNRRKMAYFAIRGVQRDVLAAVRDLDRHAVLVNDRLHPAKGSVRYVDAEMGRVLLARDVEIPANATLDLGALPLGGLPVQGAVLIDGNVDGVDLRNHYLRGEPPFVLADVRKWLKGRPLYDVD